MRLRKLQRYGKQYYMTICYPLSTGKWMKNEWPWMTLSGYFMTKGVFGQHWPTFLSLIVWVYLHSKTHRFCDRVRFGRSRSSKVDDFGTNRKRVCDFLLVINSKFGPILHRFRVTATYWLKIAYFSNPSLIWRPRSLWSLWNFAAKLTMRKLESWG